MKLLLVAALAVMAVCAAAEAPVPDSDFVYELGDDTFNSTVFAEDATPHFIMFYAPWCGHCKAVKPVFRNASQWGQTQKDHKFAQFAMLDATAHAQTAAQFGVRSYPTFIYSIRGRAYKYDGGRGIGEFTFFGRYLIAAQTQGSFLDDLSTPSKFAEADGSLPNSRANFVFVLPKSKRLASEDAVERANRVGDYSASFGRARFSIVHRKDAMSAMDSKKEEAAYDKTLRCGHKFSDVVRLFDETIKEPTRSMKQNGGLLILLSDAYAAPQVYTGEWVDENGNPGKALSQWIQEKAFMAAEEINGETFGALARRDGLLVILATPSKVPETDAKMLPILRQIARERNEDPALKKFNFGYLDAVQFSAWMEQFGFTNMQDDTPIIFGFDAQEEIVYLPDDHKAVTQQLKKTPWQTGGVQDKAIRALLADIEAGSNDGTKYTTMGKIAKALTTNVPGVGAVQKFMGVGDTEFVMVLGALVFVVLILTLALRGGGGPDYSEEDIRRYREMMAKNAKKEIKKDD